MHDKPLPRIVVFLATREAAELEGLPEEARITVTRMRYRNLPLYHVWIVGTPTEEKIVYGIVRAFNREWTLQLDDVAMDSVMLKVCRRLSSTVSAADLRRR